MTVINRNNKQRKKVGMSVVEDSREFPEIIQEVARMAAKAAVAEAKVLKIPVAYLKAGKVIRKYPDGKVEVIAKILNAQPSRTLKKGSVLHARKK